MTISPMPPIGSFGSFSVGSMAPMQAPMAPLDSAAAVEGPTKATGAGGFGEVLSNAVSALNDKAKSAANLQELAATGRLADPTAAITETAEAGIYLKTAVQVRNKLVESWQELSRMPV